MLTKKNRSISILVVLILFIPIAMFLAISAGYTHYTIGDIIRVLAGNGSVKENLIILEFRLPRVVIAILIGIAFSISGCILQGISKNPLADPGLIGINSGAGIIVLLFIVLNNRISLKGIFVMPLFAMIGALIVGGIIYKLSSTKGKGIIPIRLVLNGVAIQAGINALMTLIVMKLDDSEHEFLAKWQAGNIWGANWKYVIALTPWIIIGFIVVLFMAKKMDILVMGDEISTGLGIKVAVEKRKLLFAAIALAASAVAISGSISFVGLIAPHLSKKLVGMKHRILLPVCGLVGALLVLVADTIARIIIEPSEVPTGIVVSIIGAPYFLFLLIRSGKKSK